MITDENRARISELAALAIRADVGVNRPILAQVMMFIGSFDLDPIGVFSACPVERWAESFVSAVVPEPRRAGALEALARRRNELRKHLDRISDDVESHCRDSIRENRRRNPAGPNQSKENGLYDLADRLMITGETSGSYFLSLVLIATAVSRVISELANGPYPSFNATADHALILPRGVDRSGLESFTGELRRIVIRIAFPAARLDPALT